MKALKITSAALALALTATFAISAHAQDANFNEGDLIIGFQQTGASNNYEVDLGSASKFIDPSQTVQSFDLSTDDLSGDFTDWNSDSQTNLVHWGVIGASDKTSDLSLNSSLTLPANTLFYTKDEVTPGTLSTPPVEGSSSAQKNINTNVANFDNLFDGGASGATTTSGSTTPLAAVNVGTGTSASFSYEISSKTYFGIGSSILQNPSSTTGNGPVDSVLDLYELTPTNADSPLATTLLGEFSLDSDGVLTFDEFIAAPEPSTYALFGLGAMFLVWSLRRKSNSIL